MRTFYCAVGVSLLLSDMVLASALTVTTPTTLSETPGGGERRV